MHPERALPPVHRSRLPLAREGYTHIAAAAALTLALWWLTGRIGAAIGAVLLGLVVNFFRDPERSVPSDPQSIVAPADGRVIKVARVHDDRFLHGEATVISIFMSPLNVHVNRIPTDGRVVDVRYNPGKYFRAFADKASMDNEQTAVVIEDTAGRRLCCVQIAGFIARRIICHLQPNMHVVRGDRYGMIMFGSRADLYLPPGVAVHVNVGDRTRGAETVVARWQ